MAKPTQIYFNPQECAALAMGLGRIIEDISQLQEQPWTPEARKMRKEIFTNARSAAAKLEKFAGVKCDLPPYNPGDEQEFLTKES